MNNDVLAIALAGFMHDIGKFIQRAEINIPENFVNNNQDIYQPFINNSYQYKHSLYTAFFINKLEQEINNLTNLNIDSIPLINLSACHHNPHNVFEKIIQKADWLSSAIDRNKIKDYVPIKEYKNIRLLTIFEQINFDKKEEKEYKFSDYKYRYSLSALSPNSIFPKNTEEENNLGNYTELYDKFKQKLKNLAHKNNLQLWFEHFDSLCMVYTSLIPQATVNDTIPDASLYDHLKTTSALAQALYLYHKTNNTLNNTNIFDDTQNKFIYLKSKFNGIQNFIFAEGGQTNKNSAKLLRGRSFYISLLMELAGDMLCKNIGVEHTAIIMNAAGSITAILPNTKETKEKIKETEDYINKWLINKFYGQVSISFGYIEISGNDLIKKRDKNIENDSDGLSIIGNKLSVELDKKKYQKISIEHIKKIEDYFNNSDTVCHYCGFRPAIKKEKNEDVICDICDDLVKIGDNLAKQKQIIVLEKKDNNNISVFDKYNILFEDKDNFYLNYNGTQHILIKYWNLDINEISNSTTSIKQFGAYIPKKENNTIKTFEEIIGNDSKGINALGILKCDIDNLGYIFFKGITNRHGSSIAKYATFSRQVNFFFTIYLQHLFNTKEEFKDIYTVFAGGDDLFLIGKWDTIIDLSLYIRDKFKEYVCNNPQITFSTGISVIKPNEPIKNFYLFSEKALEKSKHTNDKNSLTIFDTTINWNNIKDFNDIDVYISDKIKSKSFNSAFLYKILYFINMATVANKIKEEQKVDNYQQMQNLKWKSLMYYFISRNNEIKGSNNKEQIIFYLTNIVENKEKRNLLKIALIKNIYKIRERSI